MPAHLDEDIDDELLFHLRSLMDENMTRGMSHEEAWDDAQSRFGSLRRYSNECRRATLPSRLMVPGLLTAGLVCLGLIVGWLTWEVRTLRRENVARRRAGATGAPPLVEHALDRGDLVGRVFDCRGEPIGGAHVLVILKTWPGGWFRQDDFATRSDAGGRFELAHLIPSDGQYAVQVAALKSGHALTSTYQLKEASDDHTLEPVTLRLDDAAAMTLVVHDERGRPVPGARVVPAVRRSADGDEHLLYFQGSEPVHMASNAAGQVALDCLERGDRAEIYIRVPQGTWNLHPIEVPPEGDVIEVLTSETEDTTDVEASSGRPANPLRQVSTQVPSAERENWAAKLAGLKKGNWRAAFAVGLELAELAPDEGFAILKENWPRIEAEEARQQILKAWVNTMPYPLHARNHPRLLDVLDLGMHDPSPNVRKWALNFVREVALADFADDFRAYEAWYAANREKPTVRVVGDAVRKFVAEAAANRDPASCAARLNDARYTFRDTVEARQAALEAGLPKLIEQWTADASGPLASRGQVELAAAGLGVLRYLNPSEDDLRRIVVPLLDKQVPSGMRLAAIACLDHDDCPGAVDLLVGVLLKRAAAAKDDPASYAALLNDARHTFRDRVEARRAAMEAGLPKMIEQWAADASEANASRGQTELAAAGLGVLVYLHLGEDDLRRIVVPLLDKQVPPGVRSAAVVCLSRDDCPWAVDLLVDVLKQAIGQDGTKVVIWNAASALAEIGDPNAIPPMIAVIEADNTYNTVYGVGYFGLGKLTGVAYDEKHDGAWWRAWWEKNKSHYQEAAKLEIPKLAHVPAQGVEQPEPDDLADVPAEDLRAGDDPQKRYFLIGAADKDQAPADGYKLLIVLPGGDGSAEFSPFVRRIYQSVLDKDWLVAEAVAPEWDKKQFVKVVWPTAKSPYPAARFTTEALIAAIIKDVRSKVKVDPQRIFMLGWSSGGPPVYATTLTKKSPITGAFVAMSIFRPNEMPALEGGKDKAFYLLQSPNDQVTRIQFAETAEEALRTAGATVKLERYPGGHGWQGNVFGMLGDGIQWLEENAAGAE